MSAQSLPIRTDLGYRTWRFALLALVVAIALASALVVLNTRSTGGAAKGSSQPNPRSVPSTFVVPDGPAQGHPLP